MHIGDTVLYTPDTGIERYGSVEMIGETWAIICDRNFGYSVTLTPLSWVRVML